MKTQLQKLCWSWGIWADSRELFSLFVKLKKKKNLMEYHTRQTSGRRNFIQKPSAVKTITANFWRGDFCIFKGAFVFPVRYVDYGTSPVAQWSNNLPAVHELQETRVLSLGPEDLPEKEMPTHSSILAWRIPWPEEPGGLQSMGLQESDTT